MTKTILICGADHNYFPMMLEWIHSIRRFPQSKDVDLGILDAGLTPAQVKKLENMDVIVSKAKWPCDIPAHKIRGRDYLMACVCRPYLKDFFPDYDLYFWMDADTWVQDWRGVDMFLQGGMRKKLTVTSRSDRAYPRGMRVKFLGPYPWKPRSFYYSNAKKAFGWKVAQKIFPYHQLLAGAFCLHKDAPHWEKWQELIEKALKSPFGKVFTAEQLTMGMLIHLEGYPAEVLPAYMHWLCEFKPLWDEGRGLFVEPSLPHEPIGILHLSGVDEMRLDRSVTDIFKTIEGKDIALSYRYPHYNGESE